MNQSTRILRYSKKKTNLFILCLLLQFSVHSQQIVTSATNPFFSISSDGTIHGSAGEIKVDHTDLCNEGVLQMFKDETTGVFSAELIEGIEMFPNPVGTQLNVTVIEDNYQFSIYSLDGSFLRKQSLSKGLNSISMKSFPEANYIIKIEDASQNYYSQLIQKF